MTPYRLWVGTYTEGDAHDGVYELGFDGKKLWTQNAWGGLTNPSYVQPVGDWVFAVEERDDGGVIAVLSPEYSTVHKYPVPGAGLCHIAVCGDKLYASGYSGGCLVGLNAEKQLCCYLEHQGRGYCPDRQEKAHVHSALPTPDGRQLLVADLGLDKLFQYQINADGSLSPHREQAWVRTNPGQGPRHFVFHPNGRWLYLVTELDLTLRVYQYSSDGSLLEYQSEYSLRSGYPCERALAADVHVSPDGRFVYASVRGIDRIFGFHVLENSGCLEPVGNWFSGGQGPRSFHVSPDGNYLAAANQISGKVVVFSMDSDSGRLSDTVAELSIPSASCVKWDKLL